jgi:hypothetical protein
VVLLAALAMGACKKKIVVVPPPVPQAHTPQAFNLCIDSLEKYPMNNLDALTSSPGNTPPEREAALAQIARVAREFRNEYWLNKEPSAGINALKFYSGYLSLSAPDDVMSPFYLMESVGIYCDLGCTEKAHGLAAELRRGYSFSEGNLSKMLGYCKN